jgi:hypothetical protein
MLTMAAAAVVGTAPIAALADTVTCESLDGQQQVCPMRLDGQTPRLIEKRSDAPCDERRTWGTFRNAVWVSGGCRAVFTTDRGPVAGGHRPGRDEVTCESEDGRRAECRIDTRDRVRLVRQLSNATCREGSSWGVGRGVVWVRDGCRAVFAAGRGGSGGGHAGNALPRQVTCESEDHRRVECRIDTRQRVRLVRKISDAACRSGRSWGTARNVVWVSEGCRAVFSSN